MSIVRPYVAPCFGRSRRTGKKVGSRHRWPRGWGKGACEYCGRFLENVLVKPYAATMRAERLGGTKRATQVGRRLGTAATEFPVKDIVGEAEMKDRLIGILAERIAQFASQREASREWKVAYPTVNAIANGHADALTFRQLCNIVWKSGATIQLGISYSG